MFLTLEGLDGSGKSLQAELITKALVELGREVVQTREPGGTKGAEELRDLVLNGDVDRWSPMTEMLIFTAARRDHIERVILPALTRGAIVVCDRFVDSTRLYQGLESDELARAVDQVHEIAIGIEADLTLIFDIDPEVAFLRYSARAQVDMRFEEHGLEFQRKRRAGFHSLAARFPQRCVLINADQSIEAVTADCMQAIRARL